MLAIFEYKCLATIVLGKDTRPVPQAAGRDQDKFDGRDRETT